MPNSSTSSSSMSSQAEHYYCFCEVPAQLKVSWTEENPGRVFYACAKYNAKSHQGGCNYSKWATTELMDGKMKELLINMKNRKDMLEMKNLMLETCLLDAN
ncbi:hypothetical protein Ancab_039879 [Ancistrocladus abbreviatus]